MSDNVIHLEGVKKVFLTDEVETHALAGIDLLLQRERGIGDLTLGIVELDRGDHQLRLIGERGAHVHVQHHRPARGLLGDIGLGPIRWHTDPLSSHIAIATMVNFRWTGYNALILLAGMQAISRDLYEAATIDGAGWVSRFFRVTLPQLRPTIIFVIITATIGGLQIFDEPRLYDQNGLGGEDQQWMTMTIYLYKLGWPQLNFGRAAAVAWLLFLVIVAIGLINLAITRRIATSEGRTA